MTNNAKTKPKYTVADICGAMESIAPTVLARSWDNVGLLAGDRDSTVQRLLVCIDLTAAVAQEAITERADFILTYHPPIFKPISSIRADSSGTDAALFSCIRNGINVYATHTALDAAEGGTNDVLAALCGAKQTEPIEYADGSSDDEYKLVVFVPPNEVETVADAMFSAGAGKIGDYTQCSFRIKGRGTFFGGESTQPAVGKKERQEFVDETRIETVVPAKLLSQVVRAMTDALSYEEPAYDIYPLKPHPVRGIGRTGALAQPTTLIKLARKLKRATQTECIQIVGPAERTIGRIVVVAGAAGSLPLRVPLTPNHAIITGEIRHHDALSLERYGCTAVALGHWASERPVLGPLAERLETMLPGLASRVSQADKDPFGTIRV